MTAQSMPEGIIPEATESNIPSPSISQNTQEDVTDDELRQFEPEAQGFVKDALEIDLSTEASRLIGKADKYGISIESLERLEKVSQIEPQVLAKRIKDIESIQANIREVAV